MMKKAENIPNILWRWKRESMRKFLNSAWEAIWISQQEALEFIMQSWPWIFYLSLSLSIERPRSEFVWTGAGSGVTSFRRGRGWGQSLRQCCIFHIWKGHTEFREYSNLDKTICIPPFHKPIFRIFHFWNRHLQTNKQTSKLTKFSLCTLIQEKKK